MAQQFGTQQSKDPSFSNAEQWEVDGPRIIDVGGEDEPVTELKIGVVSGRVDVVTHDDSPTARVEVADVEGPPLRVRWSGGTLTISHGRDSDRSLLDLLRRTVAADHHTSVRVSISVPVGTRTSVATVSAEALVSGVRARTSANTVSGTLTLNDLAGDLDLNTVSGAVECDGVSGPLRVNAVSGSVTVRRGDLPSVKVNTVSGDIALDLVRARSSVTSHSVSGDVTVRAPLTGFDVRASSASGQVVVDGRTLSRPGRHGSGEGGRTREGDGALEVRANAVSGNIVVLRAEPRDAQPRDAGWTAAG